MEIKEIEMLENSYCFKIENNEYFITHNDLKEAVQKLYFWQYRNDTCFSAKLYSLIAKADNVNKKKLMLAYPTEVIAYLMREQKGQIMEYKLEKEEEFFNYFGVRKDEL